MAHFRPDINPDLLAWAREWGNVPIEELEHFHKDYLKWERGEAFATLNQLERLAKKYRVPLGYLLLPEPPEIDAQIPDFRSFGERRPSPELHETIGLMLQRQEFARKYFLEEGKAPLAFVGSQKQSEDPVAVAQSMWNVLGLSENWAASCSNYEAALLHLRRKAESARIMISISGYAGRSTRRSFDVEEFRGFVLSDRYAPLIFVNGRDFSAAQMFTVAHELAHLWIDQDALFDLPRLQASNQDREQFCDQVAAEFLIPKTLLEDIWSTALEKESPVHFVAKWFKVSQIVAARRAKDLGFMTQTEFYDFYDAWLERAKLKREQEAKKAKEDDITLPVYWQTQGMRIGKLFGQTVIRALRKDRLQYMDAYRLTGLSDLGIDKFAKRIAS